MVDYPPLSHGRSAIIADIMVHSMGLSRGSLNRPSAGSFNKAVGRALLNRHSLVISSSLCAVLSITIRLLCMGKSI